MRQLMDWLPRMLKTAMPPRSCVCGEIPINSPAEIIVWGAVCHINSSPMCKNCTEKYMERHATMCETCKEPILVGMSVGAGLNGGYVHFNTTCAPPGLFVGAWGEGEPIPAKEQEERQ